MEIKQNIAKNTTWLTSSYIFQKIFAFIYFTIIARILGANDIGFFVFAISLTTIFSVFIDFGLSPVLIREIAKFKEKINTYLNNIILIKSIFAILAAIAVIIVINLLNKPPLINIMVYLAVIMMIFDSFTLSFWAIFRGLQNLKYEAISILINQILIILIGLAAVFLKLPLYYLVIALLFGSTFSLLYSFSLIRIKLNYRFKPQWDKKIIKTLLKIAIPFALAGIFTRVYSYIDQVLLSVLIGDQSLGWYSVAYKMTYALQFIPAAFAAAIFPAMSHYYVCEKEKVKQIFEKSMFFLIIFSIPIAVGVAFLAQQIILFLYTQEFQPSVLTLQIFIFASIAIFLSYPVGAILNACNKQTINTINLGITMVLNIILNLILIPIYQHLGAAIAAIISLFVMLILNLVWVPTIINYDYKYLLKKLIKVIIAASVMAGFLYYFKTIHFILLIFIGAFIYLAVLYAIKGFTKNDLNYIWSAVIKKNI